MSRKLLRALEVGLTAVGLAWLLASIRSEAGVELLVIWNGLAIVYMVTGWLLLRRDLPAARPEELFGPRWYTTVLALVASGSGLTAGFVMVADTNAGDELAQGVSAATVLVSWLLLHTAFAQIYAHAFFAGAGLRFPDCPTPGLTEFVYFSFVIGTSFAVSDVLVVSTAMRRRVTAHSVLSFFFNVAVVAIAIDWLKG
ncbi:DUF1345 domain-containing protein [Nocardia cyriacigeorgica]|uniref:DUF1345 domain-containing protein n=1 Tax=Nocardia cyriacigeorgica TaxID=135487 RepID=A0A6P1D7G9_9NOCA|nr:DUF1345 domain-containing protein [Nocardia cyriacigeorgica]NEW41172.1 DUF1345 domain-containing protein [Nocardia cyriacigeorgica]NEW44172.1 DUF1345 domain-containing protein [Nocardia cyriacigeorgica]NEW52075.1 DUF1345 domain-containing protein [Nocardia cyriacigeorgica]NEW59572.1 DUF1345 domain-containing protein [Nocardia cyriacigeorgica]